MSRDSTGNYSSPSGDFVTATVIDSNVMNGKLQDLGTEITDSLSRSGKGGMLARMRGVNGTSNLPAYAFTDETTLGFWRAGAADLRVASNGTDIQKWSPTSVTAYQAFSAQKGATVTTSTSNGAGTTSTGNGTGAGVVGTGGATGNGGTFTGGATSGAGASGTGTGASGSGIVGQGAGSGSGGIFAGGATGPGVSGTGGGTSLGGSFANGTAATGATPQNAVELTNGNLKLSGTAPNSDASLTNTLTPANINKAWATIITASGAATLDDGFNIASVATNANGIDVTFAAAFANTKYCPVVTPDLIVTMRCTIVSSTVVRISGYKVSNDATNGDLVDINSSPYAGQYFLHVHGRQA